MPIVVQLTPAGRGAVATLLVEGPAARDLVAMHFRPAAGRTLASYAPERASFGRFGPEPGEEVVVHPASEQAVEIHCHGGHGAITRLTDILTAAGCRLVDWRDWARSHHEDPITADARVALADARTQRAAEILLDQYQGSLRRAVDGVAALLDDGNAAEAARGLDELLALAPLGLHLAAPWHVVLAGPPNVGKSSLINALVGYQRALVHSLPGTTRDVVTATTALDGWPVELSDTAGLRAGHSPVEQAGIALARQRLATADLTVLVFDASKQWSEADHGLLASYPEALVVHNKWDLLALAPPEQTDGDRGPRDRESRSISAMERAGMSTGVGAERERDPRPLVADSERPGGIHTSATRGDGIEELASTIAHRLVPSPPPPGAAVPVNARHVEALQSAAVSLAHGDPHAARRTLASV